MRKVHNCDINRCVTLYCPIENCDQSYDRYNALDTHLTHVHYAEIRKETFNFSDLQDFETWLRDITSSSKTKYIKRSCNNSYRYYRCHRSGLPKTSTDKINSMKSSVKIGRHCPSRIIAKITERSVQVEFVPTHIGHDCEIAKIPLSQKKRQDIACRLATSANTTTNLSATSIEDQQKTTTTINNAPNQQEINHNQASSHLPSPPTTVTTNPQTATRQQSSTNIQPLNTNTQSTTSAMLQNDNPLMVTLSPLKTTTVAVQNAPQQQQQLAAHPAMQQQSHIISHQITNGTNVALMPVTNPNRQELTSRFDQLMLAIRSDKHASIVKAQLEVCFALIRD